MKAVQEKLEDGKAKKIVLSSCDAVSAGLLAAYYMFQKAYIDVKAGKKPDFKATIPFPPPPPSPPSGDADSISWFQLGWDAVRAALSVAAQKSDKLAEIFGPLEAAGDQLVKDLDKYFGPTKPGEKLPLAENALEVFPPTPRSRSGQVKK